MPIGDSRSRPSEVDQQETARSIKKEVDDEVLVAASSSGANEDEEQADQNLRKPPTVSIDDEDDTPAGTHNPLSKARYVFQLNAAKK